LRQVLINIIGNAVKFTENGSVDLTVKLVQVNDKHLLEFLVSDTGIGIDISQQAALFQPFTQGDHSVSRRFGGTGLGLALSRRFARALGGDVRLIQSEPKRGSVFSITIDPGDLANAEFVETFCDVKPLKAVAADAAQQSPDAALSGVKVLLVEDGPDNQILYQHLLKSAGAEVVAVRDGMDAVRYGRCDNLDLILMDIQLPVLDGYSATKILRRQGAKLPIIALTAHAMKEERDRCLKAGCDDWLAKPTDFNQLICTVAKWTQRGAKIEATH
jgi:CheY-like chemotaxis protein